MHGIALHLLGTGLIIGFATGFQQYGRTCRTAPTIVECVYDELLQSMSQRSDIALSFCEAAYAPTWDKALEHPVWPQAPQYQETRVASACTCLMGLASQAISPTTGTSGNKVASASGSSSSTVPITASASQATGSTTGTSVNGGASANESIPSTVPITASASSLPSAPTISFTAQVASATQCTITPSQTFPGLLPLNGTDISVGYNGTGSNLYVQFQGSPTFEVEVASTHLTFKNATGGDFGIDDQGNFFYILADCSQAYIFSQSGSLPGSKHRSVVDRAPPSVIGVTVQFVNSFRQPNGCISSPVLLCHDLISGDDNFSELESTSSPGLYVGSCPFSEQDDYNRCVSDITQIISALGTFLKLKSVFTAITTLSDVGPEGFCLDLAVDILVALGITGASLSGAILALSAGAALAIPGAAAVGAFFLTCVYEADNLFKLFVDITTDKLLEAFTDDSGNPDAICKFVGNVGDDRPTYEIGVINIVDGSDGVLAEADIFGISLVATDLTATIPNTCTSATSTATSTTSMEPSITPTATVSNQVPSATPSGLICGLQEGVFCDQGLTGDQSQCCDNGLVCADYLCVPQCDSVGVNCDHIPDICQSECGAQNAPGTPPGT